MTKACVRLVIARSPAILFALGVLAVVASLAAPADALPKVGVEFLPIGGGGDGWHPVGRARLTVLPDAPDANEINFRQIIISDANPTYQPYITGVAIGVDVNGDGNWDPVSDDFHPAFPASTGAVNEPVFFGPNNAFVTTRFSQFFFGWVASWSSNGAAVPVYTMTTAAPTDLIILYRLAPDSPAEATFLPLLPGNFWSTVQVIPFEWWGFDTPDGLVHFPEYRISGLFAEDTSLQSEVAVRPGDTDRVVGRFRVHAVGEDGPYTINSFTAEPGKGQPTHIHNLRLVEDLAGDGYDESDLLIGLPGRGFNTAEVIEFHPAEPITILDGEDRHFLLMADFSPSVKVNMVYSVRLTDADTTPDAMGNLPLLFPGLTASFTTPPKVEIGLDGEENKTAAPGSAQVLATVVRLDAFNGEGALSSISLTGVGDTSAVSAITVAHDVNGDGQFNEEVDTVVATGAFDDATGTATLDFDPLRMTSGGRLQLLVLLDLNPAAARGQYVGVRVDSLGLSSNLSVSGLPITSGTIEVESGSDDDDPWFDPEPVGPFTVPGGTAGCTAGAGTAATGLLLVAVAMALSGLAFRRRITLA